MILASEVAKRSIELALDEAFEELDRLLDKENPDNSDVALQLTRIARLEKMLGAMP